MSRDFMKQIENRLGDYDFEWDVKGVTKPINKHGDEVRFYKGNKAEEEITGKKIDTYMWEEKFSYSGHIYMNKYFVIVEKEG